MKIEFINNGKHSTLTIITPSLFIKRHSEIALAAVFAAPKTNVNTTGFFVLRTIISGETADVWEAAMKARQLAEKYC